MRKNKTGEQRKYRTKTTKETTQGFMQAGMGTEVLVL